MNINNIARDADFKDENPIRTVENIKNILGKYGIETDVEWAESSVPYCYSLRVTVVGTTFGTNGKGVTKEFALASAYGELMERLQLGYIGVGGLQKDGNFSINDSQNETVSVKDLLSKNEKWYNAFSDGLFMFTGERCSSENIIKQYADENGNIVVTPYYCLNTQTKEYLPTVMRKSMYTANGCAAGNTPEEAIVQALSEIAERHCLIRMINEDVTPPDIPEQVLKQFQISYDIISYLRNNGFRVVVKDCSFGEKFPVVSVCIIDKKTGRYHTHFGAYPVFEIALQRSLTESFQGRNIESIAEHEDFQFKKESGFDISNLRNELIFGVSKKSAFFFEGNPKYPYNNDVGFCGENNKQLFRQCIEYFKSMGLDILVRDCSCLGFPTYQVIIPGYSEVFYQRLSPKHDENRFMKCAMRAMRNPSSASVEDLLGFLIDSLKSSKNISTIASLPLKLTANETSFILNATLAFANYTLSRYNDVLKYLDVMIKKCDKSQLEKLICLKRYISLTIRGFDNSKIKSILETFHNKATVEALYSNLNNGNNPFDEYTMHCDMNCYETCDKYSCCCQSYVNQLIALINSKTKELDFDSSCSLINTIL
ncbi:MAG: YcaO-like family protein [Clostridia bacterium]|nr:YcaO-like family protein [Clostridia bacterium]